MPGRSTGRGTTSVGADPAGEALVAGRGFYYVERTDVGGRTLYRLHVVEHTPQRIVLSTENVTAIRAALVTLFEPGALQMATVLSNDGPSAWSFYEISRAGADSSSFVARLPERLSQPAGSDAALYGRAANRPRSTHRTLVSRAASVMQVRIKHGASSRGPR